MTTSISAKPKPSPGVSLGLSYFNRMVRCPTHDDEGKALLRLGSYTWSFFIFRRSKTIPLLQSFVVFGRMNESLKHHFDVSLYSRVTESFINSSPLSADIIIIIFLCTQVSLYLSVPHEESCAFHVNLGHDNLVSFTARLGG